MIELQHSQSPRARVVRQRWRDMQRARPAFTLVELLVVIAIIAMLVSIMLPAVQATRAAARRAQCKSNLFEVVLATQNYEMAYEHFPAGVRDTTTGPIDSAAQGLHQSWTIALLPYLDETAIFQSIQPDVSVYDAAHQPVREIRIATLTCPSSPVEANVPVSDYAACHHDVEAPIASDNSGVFFVNSQVTADDILDGMSHTIFFGEKVPFDDDLGWMSGTHATLRNTGTPLNTNPWKSVVQISFNKAKATKLVDEVDASSGEDGRDLAETTADAEEGQDFGADQEDDGSAPEDELESEEGQSDEEDESDEEEGVYDEDLDEYGDEDDMESGWISDPYGRGYGDQDLQDPNRVVTQGPKQPRTPLTVGGFGSSHPGGVHFAFGDGRIQFMPTDTDPQVLQQLGHRRDGKLLSADDYRN